MKFCTSKHQKTQLDNSRLRLAEALDTFQDSIILLNEDLDIVFANSEAKALIAIDGSGFEQLNKEWHGPDQSDLDIQRYIDEESTRQLSVHVNSNKLISQLTLRFNSADRPVKVLRFKRRIVKMSVSYRLLSIILTVNI